jgi:EmrB/QacA subfamily drug resistance transporter
MTPLSREPLEAHVVRIMIVIVLGAIMSVLDTTIVNVALHDLGRDFHSSLDQIQWIATGYMLAIAAMIPVTGWATRRFGGRRLYIVSLVLFTAGSVLCALAWSAGSLIAFRILQGVGGGMLMPVGQMILVKAAGPKNLPRVMSAIGVPIVLAPIFGPSLGGLLLEHAGWQWIFLVNVPIGIAAVIAATRLLPHDEPEEAGRLDALGLALVATGVVGITYGLAESGHTGSLTAGSVLLPALGGLALVTLFVVRALRIERPLVDVRLFADPAFSAAAVTTFCLGAALFGAMILMPLYFQTVRGEGATATGLLLAPQGVGAALAMHLSARATHRFGAGATAVAGSVIAMVATVPFALIGAGTSYVAIGAMMAVRGLGIGLSMMPAMTAAFARLDRAQVNDATPQLTVLQRVGGSMGTAILTVVLQRHLTAGAHTPAGAAHAFGLTYWWVLAIAAIALVPTIALMVLERRAAGVPADEHVPAALAAEAA